MEYIPGIQLLKTDTEYFIIYTLNDTIRRRAYRSNARETIKQQSSRLTDDEGYEYYRLLSVFVLSPAFFLAGRPLAR